MRLLNVHFEHGPLNMQKFCLILDLTRLIYRKDRIVVS